MYRETAPTIVRWRPRSLKDIIAYMTPTEIFTIFERHPDDAFRLQLASGDNVIVDNPRRIIIEELMLYVGQADDPDSPFARTVRYVSIPNITLVERIDRGQLRRRSPRRR